MAEARVEEILNYLPIDGRLSTAGQPSVEELAALARAGYEVVINIALHDDARYALPDEAGTVAALGMTYVDILVQFGAPTEADFHAFSRAMRAHEGQQMLVHCAANKRVTAFLGLYRVIELQCELQWGAAQAFAPMRDIWQPNPVWAAFIAAMLAKADTRADGVDSA